MQPVRVHGWVHGRVQGVGFRFFVVRHARDLGLAGWVRNLADGRVEFVAEGPQPAVEALVRLVRRGPAGAVVADVETVWEPPAGARGFGIGYDE